MKWKARRGIAAAALFAIVCCGCSTTARQPTFDPMPLDQNYLTTVLGPVTGVGSRTFTVPASRSMSLTVGCIGKGKLEVSGLLSAASLCGDANLNRGIFGSWYWGHMSVRAGERIKLRVVARAKTIWDIRVDGLPRHCKDDVCVSTAQP